MCNFQMEVEGRGFALNQQNIVDAYITIMDRSKAICKFGTPITDFSSFHRFRVFFENPLKKSDH